MPIAQSDPYQVQEICHLKKQPRAAEALELLKRVALQVQPIMHKRQWAVRKLSEFVPKSNNLLGLNVNRGAEVKIRLRPPGQEDSFYPWEHVLGTMLHELCHNNIGPHNAAFYKLLDELWREADDLLDRGVTGTGQGFDAPSAGRLGAYSFIPTHNPPQDKMADAIRKAAEARAQKQALMPAGPQKLGGNRAFSDMTPAQAAAAAAERRACDNTWCGAEHTPEQVQQEASSRDTSPAVSIYTVPATATSVVAGQGQAAPAVAGAGSRVAQSSIALAVSSRSASAAADGRAAAAAEQAVVERQQKSQQDSALQQQWLVRVQRQQQQRQQTSQRVARKRPAPEAIDLTLSDAEDESGPLVAGNAAGAQPCSCTSCHAGGMKAPAADGTGTAAPGGTHTDSSGGAASCCRVWCAQRCRWLQDCQLSKPLRARIASQADAGTAKLVSDLPPAVPLSGEWSCPVCTLLNRALALQCEACLTVKPC